MSAYVYTLRSDTIDVDGMVIGRYAYAYKPTSYHASAQQLRFAASMEARGDKAVSKLFGKIKAVVFARDFNVADSEPLTVYQLPDGYMYGSVLDDVACSKWKQLGTIERVNDGRKKFFRFTAVDS